MIDDISTIIKNLTIGQLYSNSEDKNYCWKHAIKRLQSFLTLPDTVKMAGRWLLNSYCTENQLLSFVQAITALEVLIGEEKESKNTGIKSLLANRTAYFIGDSHEKRLQIIEEIKEIYTTRCDIVHKGKEVLSIDEKKQLLKLQFYLHRIILEEIELNNKKSN